MNQNTHHLEASLKRLKLPGILMNMHGRSREAMSNQLGYIDFLALLIEDEILSREANNLEKRIKAAGFTFNSTFESFDYSFNSSIFPAATLNDLASCRFITNAKNLVLCGPPGIGKSHIAQAIGHEACRRGMDVLYRKTSKLIEDLSDKMHPRRVSRTLKRCTRSELLILDDFAFRKYSQCEAELLYSIADERLGQVSTILTSNRPPQDWYSVFPDPVIGGAILDRLVAGAIKIVVTKGRSYRKEYPGKINPDIDKEGKNA